ncbi:hypothetical protein LCER1_G002956 [Lachnellula cervina]|uniref:MFS maltose permease n=1 Tax=Lachnellula cervina TaxID=1316786 RepID=A0A7D8US27_9HELO|nr:hypothetical protein LCER1_G002956 [Lachnellula cervina]
MRPRLPARRIPLLRPFRPPNSPTLRPFTRNTLARPNLPYLSNSSQRPTARFLTIETKQWIKDEVRKGLKYTAYIYTFVALGIIITFGVYQERFERQYHPPPEWSWVTRYQWKMVMHAEDPENKKLAFVDYAITGSIYLLLIARLEDPNGEGAGLQEQGEGGILVEGVGRTGFDISNKSEQWRRGYYGALMGAARAAEHLDDWLKDPVRMLMFPKSVVPGPSNPHPKPIPPGAATPSREEDCEKAFESPETFYMRILTTKGFTEKQRVDAALACGAWLDFKGTRNTAMEMYKWAMDIATSSSTSTKPVIDTATGTIDPTAGPASANVLSVATAIAVHHALCSNLALALPVFISILRSRRSLPDPPSNLQQQPAPDEGDTSIAKTIASFIHTVFVAPPYPPPPPDGTEPPQRTSQELCEEAGVMANIGEILFASKSSKTSKEDGLAWTREAVDIAEEELRTKRPGKDAKKTCKQCLEVALGNWETMIARLAREEREAKAQGGKVGGWLGFGGEEQKDMAGRWESEENVVKERRRRVMELFEVMPGPKRTSILSV